MPDIFLNFNMRTSKIYKFYFDFVEIDNKFIIKCNSFYIV